MQNYNLKLKIKQTFAFLLVLLTFTFYLLNSGAARAQVTSQVMTVIPPKLEIKANPGDTVRKTIQFRNEGSETIYLTTAVKDFIVNDTKGTPEFVNVPVSGRWSAASWIKASPTTLSVIPGQTVNIQVVSNIPLDARPGGHYAAVIYETSTSKVQRIGNALSAGSGTTQVVGTLVYVTVAGPVSENAFVRRFEAPKFLEYGPVNFLTEIVNQSDIHIAPQGTITVRDTFGKTVAVLNLEARNIFPGASVIYNNVFSKESLFGRYRADFNAPYGTQGQVLAATLFFWVIPWKMMTIVILAILIILMLIVLFKQKLQRRQEEFEERLLEDETEITKLKKELKKKSE